MRKILATLLVVVMLVSFATVTVGASSYDYNAEELNKLGLLLGTDDGFELDSAPTRAQAVVMLIRLLGLEEAAKEEGGEHPFTDVPEWADAYIGYAYANELARGMSETEFQPDGQCSAQMYVTFVLRALGYDDDVGDFSYADAILFGTDVGIVDAVLVEGDFLRDQMVAISYLALFMQPKDSDFETLLAALVDAGAVEADAAEAAADAFVSPIELADDDAEAEDDDADDAESDDAENEDDDTL